MLFIYWNNFEGFTKRSQDFEHGRELRICRTFFRPCDDSLSNSAQLFKLLLRYGIFLRAFVISSMREFIRAFSDVALLLLMIYHLGWDHLLLVVQI